MKYLYIDSTSRTITERDDGNPVEAYRATLRSGQVERYHHLRGYELVVDAYGRDFEDEKASFTLAGLQVIGDGVLKTFYGLDGQVRTRASREELEAMIEWHNPSFGSDPNASSSIFERMMMTPDEHEAFLAEARQRCCHRFAISHGDASLFIDEIELARRKLGLEYIEDDSGLPILFVTDDPKKVEAYKALMSDWLWQVWDNETKTLEEA